MKFKKANTPYRIMKPELRSKAYITVLSNATVYILKNRVPNFETYLDNGFPISLYGVHELVMYQGEMWGVSDTDDTDVRVIEY